MNYHEKLRPKLYSKNRVIPPAMIDRIELVIGDWAIDGRGTAVAQFEDKLGGVEAMTRDGELVRIFRSPKRSKDGKVFNADIATGHKKGVNSPLRTITSGEFKSAFGTHRVPRGSKEHIRLGLEIGLNMNHYLAAQSFKRLYRPRHPIIHKPNVIVASDSVLSYDSEFCLTDDRNWLLGKPALIDYVLSKLAEDHLMDCIDSIETTLESEMLSIARYCENIRLAHDPYYSLRKVEFCWEFSHPNPIRFVEGLDISLREQGLEWTRGGTPIRKQIFQIKQNSPCVRVELAGGCELAVYAKTNKRVRFEVRLKQDAIASILDKTDDEAGRTTRTKVGLHKMVATLRNAATKRLETALAMLNRQRVPPLTDITSLQLCALVGRLLDDDDLAHTVLEELRLSGRIAGKHGSIMGDAAKTLADPKIGILARLARHSPVFVPCDRYLSAVQGLRGFPMN